MTTRPHPTQFRYEHLPEHLAAVSKPFCDLANMIATTMPVNEESDMALRKMLEAKDCAVRSVLLSEAVAQHSGQGQLDLRPQPSPQADFTCKEH